MDNDWDSTGFLTFLVALDAGMEVLALASNTCNSWVDQISLHAVCLVSISSLQPSLGLGNSLPTP